MSKERPVFRSAIFVAVENEQGEVLLQRRQNTGFLDGYWDLSGSGHLEYGESTEQCGARETNEEVGLTVQPGGMKMQATFQAEFQQDVHYLSVLYRCTNWTGEPVNGEPGKIAELRWFRPENFPDKLTVGARIYLLSLGVDTVKNYFIGPKEYREMMGHDYDD